MDFILEFFNSEYACVGVILNLGRAVMLKDERISRNFFISEFCCGMNVG